MSPNTSESLSGHGDRSDPQLTSFERKSEDIKAGEKSKGPGPKIKKFQDEISEIDTGKNPKSK